MQIPAEEDDFYAILGVSPQATLDEIKAAFRKKALESHPDKQGGTPEANAAFKKVNEARDVLIDEEKRAEYDKERLAINLFKATVAGNAQAITDCVQRCFDPTYTCRRFSYKLENRKANITALELAIAMKRLDLVTAFFSMYNAQVIAALLHQGFIYQIAVDFYDQEIFSFLTQKVGQLNSFSARRQLAASTLPAFVTTILLDPRYPLFELAIIHALFSNLTEVKRKNLILLISNYCEGGADFICHLLMKYTALKSQATLTNVPMPSDCYLSKLQELGFRAQNYSAHKISAIITAFITYVKDGASALPIWQSLDSLGIQLTQDILLSVVMNNPTLLEGLLQFAVSKPLPSLPFESLVSIYFAVLKIDFPITMTIAITKCLLKVISDLFLWKDGFRNNCIHLVWNRSSDFLNPFLDLLAETLTKEQCLALLYESNSMHQLPGPLLIANYPEFAKKIGLNSRPLLALPRLPLSVPRELSPALPTGTQPVLPLGFSKFYQFVPNSDVGQNPNGKLPPPQHSAPGEKRQKKGPPSPPTNNGIQPK